jgi:hypothetical protein
VKVRWGHAVRLRRTITCGVIAALPNPFDIGGIDVQDHLAFYIAQENHMLTYQIHTIASAPEKSKPALEQLEQAFGVIPNIAAVTCLGQTYRNDGKRDTGFYRRGQSSEFGHQDLLL